MTGAQLQAIAEVAEKVTQGILTPEAGAAVISAGFPDVPPELIAQIVGQAPQAPAAPEEINNTLPEEILT